MKNDYMMMVGVFLKKAGERLTTGLLEEMCEIPPERRSDN
jgi:hypothetical protein